MITDFDTSGYIADLEQLNMPERQMVAAETVKTLGATEKKSTIVDATNSLSDTDKKEVAARIEAGLPKPDGKTNNWIWILVVSAFVLVFVGTAASMVYSLLGEGEKAAAFDKLLIIFTTVVGFLVGLLSPSPVKSS
ncbi:MAG: hypothetical protein KA956_12640 [Pyrinomonadaceae bacterium]|nr:hypothetical protein [Acidobacteriota bacterium]MBP7377315.1 hypothetical protein [Pyrinomonadaceae bacterium]